MTSVLSYCVGPWPDPSEPAEDWWASQLPADCPHASAMLHCRLRLGHTLLGPTPPSVPTAKFWPPDVVYIPVEPPSAARSVEELARHAAAYYSQTTHPPDSSRPTRIVWTFHGTRPI